MSNAFLGVPLPIWGVLCLGVAALYFFVWPKPKTDGRAQRRSPRVHFVLRWFHSVVWLLLAVACFLWASGGSALADALALLALLVYLAFMLTLLAERRSRQSAG